MKKRQTIVYVNFAPYDNAGRILDYLIDNYEIIIHFSYDHLRLKKGRRSKITIYKNKKKILQKNLIWLRTHPILLFPSLPFVAFAIVLQTIWYVTKYKKLFGAFDKYLTVNAYTAWTGNILRKMGLIKETIFWVWDYFPTDFPDWRLRLARMIYLKFDKPAMAGSDHVVILNKKLLDIRKKLHILPKNAHYHIVPIGTNPTTSLLERKRVVIGHLGMLKWGQGLDLLFDVIPVLIRQIPKLKIEIIGSGPDENHFRKRARQYAKFVKFYGFIENDDEVDRRIKKWSVGVATYVPDKSSEHYWTDPSKIKAYLNQGVPVITTNVPEFAKEVVKAKAGLTIDYFDPQDFITGIKRILQHEKYYAKNALKLARKYDYHKLYRKLLG